MAEAPAVVLQQLQELILDAVHCTWEGIQQLLKKCTGLHKLELFGISACIFDPPPFPLPMVPTTPVADPSGKLFS